MEYDPFHPINVLLNPVHPDLIEELKHWKVEITYADSEQTSLQDDGDA